MQDKSHIPASVGATLCQLDLFPSGRNSELNVISKQPMWHIFKHPENFTVSQREYISKFFSSGKLRLKYLSLLLQHPDYWLIYSKYTAVWPAWRSFGQLGLFYNRALLFASKMTFPLMFQHWKAKTSLLKNISLWNISQEVQNAFSSFSEITNL